MYNKRINPQRDENEPEIVDALRKAGYHVDRIDGEGVPDLLVIRKSLDVPAFIVETPEAALMHARYHPICLLEVKMKGGRLRPKQRDWFAKVLNNG